MFHFLLRKRLSYVYIVITSMTHNKHLTQQLKVDNDSILAKSGTKILSLNLEYIFVFRTFL